MVRLLFSLGILLLITLMGCNKAKNVITQNDMFSKHQVASIVHLKDLEIFLEKADAGIVRWVTAQTKNDNPEKRIHINLWNSEKSTLISDLKIDSKKWKPEKVEKLSMIINQIDTLELKHKEIMNLLNSFESYLMNEKVFICAALLNECQTLSKEIKINLGALFQSIYSKI